ncbi:MAG TPA: hypothetical protein PK349_06390 [Candidatus Hydrogenedentes bacterium]|nr:hypothetical protein [Candidatus Hydrogenedentota bacterium]
MNTIRRRRDRDHGLARSLRFLMTVVVPVAVMVLPSMVRADEVAPPPHGRVSFDGGGMLIRGLKDTDWSRVSINTLALPGDTLWVDEGGASELEFAGGTFLRMADASKVELVALTPSFQFRGWIGSFYVQRLVGAPGQCLMQTPACSVEVYADSAVRVDIVDNGGVTITVRWGSAEVRTDNGGSVRVSQGYRVWVDPGMLPSDPVAIDRSQSDAFDQWNADRAALLANGVKTLPREIPVVSAIGAAELATNGTWVYIDDRPCWRPVIVDYVPFRYGYWNYVPAVGHVWVGAYPFCYVTEHYGRWRYVSAYGWVWTYDPVWSPAWAVTISVGDRFLWAPCDFYARPVLVADAAVFSVGDLSFSVAAVSWMPATYVTTGCAVVYPATPAIVDVVRTVPVTQVNIWNIYVNTSYPRRVPRPVYPVDTIRVRDYNPPRSIRGVPQALLAEDVTPSARARVLESRVARATFQPTQQAGTTVRDGINRSVRTTPLTADNRTALLPRSVRLPENLSATQPTGGIDRRIRAQMAKDTYEIPARPAGASTAARELPVSGMGRPVAASRASDAAQTRVPGMATPLERTHALRTPRGGAARSPRSGFQENEASAGVPTFTNTTPHRPFVNVGRSSAGGDQGSPAASSPVTVDRSPVPVNRESRTIRPETMAVPEQKGPARTPVRVPETRPTDTVPEFAPRVAVRDMEPASPMLPGRSRGSSGSGSTTRPTTPPSRPPADTDRSRDTDRGRTIVPSTRGLDPRFPAVTSAPSVTRDIVPTMPSSPGFRPMTGSSRPMTGLPELTGGKEVAPPRVPSVMPETARRFDEVAIPRVEQPMSRSPRIAEISHPSPRFEVPSRQFSPRVAPVITPTAPSARGGAAGGFSRMR